ncbi:hypothetical protein Slin15195_G080600 [Septoria linicola]|uniref:Uncharacterized protein n=1 Tax=Septoria linicola TaxID=215465 RepID=A0A9Q9AZT7_9PEZI|nr:hypothetical protein Slin15195_G080600 [Septoria linicola]
MSVWGISQDAPSVRQRRLAELSIAQMKVSRIERHAQPQRKLDPTHCFEDESSDEKWESISKADRRCKTAVKARQGAEAQKQVIDDRQRRNMNREKRAAIQQKVEIKAAATRFQAGREDVVDQKRNAKKRVPRE